MGHVRISFARGLNEVRQVVVTIVNVHSRFHDVRVFLQRLVIVQSTFDWSPVL